MFRRESHFKSAPAAGEPADLFYQSWTPEGDIRGTIVITHGHGEHSECYNHTANELAREGWQTFAWDLRGHGRSSGARGYIGDFQDYARDLEAFLQHLQAQKSLRFPTILFAHSLGGLVLLRYLVQNPDNKFGQAVVLSAPLLGLTLKVSKAKDMAARVLRKWLPKITLSSDMDFKNLHRDEERLKWYHRDPLRHEKASPGLYFGILESCELVANEAGKIKLPCLLQLAGEDRVVSTPAAASVFSKIGSADKEMIVYDGCLHEIYNDLEQEQVRQDLYTFLNRRFPKGQK